MLIIDTQVQCPNPVLSSIAHALFTQGYATNPYSMVTAADKVGLRNIVEAGMRAQSGLPLQRPLGSPVVKSPWNEILLSPRQLFQLPTATLAEIDTTTVIGMTAQRPLNLSMPVMITGMSYGGSLSLKLKTALAKGSATAGTSTNTGESAVTQETRTAAKYLIGQYNRGGWLQSKEQLDSLDAIEVQLGQGAWGGAVEQTIPANKIGTHLRDTWHLEENQTATRYARMPGVTKPEDVVTLVNNLKAAHDVPIGVKIAASDFLEYDLAVVAQTKADYIVIDGAEGGTAVAPPTLQDDLGLPTLYGLVRAVDWLNKQGMRGRFAVIGAGGLRTPGQLLKALAIGADAAYIGTAAVLAAVFSQAVKKLPEGIPAQMMVYGGKHAGELNVDQAATSLANFLFSCAAEMKMALQAMGKTSAAELTREDLVTTNKDLAEFMGIRYAGCARE